MSPIANADELLGIINDNQLQSVFQPIVDLRERRLFGYEALSRGPANSPLHSPYNLFDTASKTGLLSKLEFACRDAACRRFSHFQLNGKLFINVSPISLLEDDYEEGVTQWLLSEYGLSAEQIVIELSEQYPLDDYQLLRRAFEHFRNEGFQIAIDDLGAGYAGLRAWSELRPDYVKIDRHFIDHIDQDPVKREFVRSIQEIAQQLDCQTIAEGIETEDELKLVHSLGIHFGQGYFLGRPETIPARQASVVDKLNCLELQYQRMYRISQTVADLIQEYPSIAPECSLNEVIDLFHSNRVLSCLPIVENQRPLGIIAREEILELMSGRYSRELHGKKPAAIFMDESAVIVDCHTALEDVSRLLTQGDDNLRQDFIITCNDHYYGIGKTSTLLRKITEQQIKNARYSNPLTLLPGNVPIYEQLDRLISNKHGCHVAYCDLDNFKPFNDQYGYSLGDEVLVLLSQLLQEHSDSSCDFVGHIGGDDFVIIFQSENWQQRCEAMLQQFEQEVQQFYSHQALQEGGIWSVNRRGEKQFYPLLSLSIGVVDPDPQACRSHHDIAALAVEAKQQAKQIDNNSLFLSRRRQPEKRFNRDQLELANSDS